MSKQRFGTRGEVSQARTYAYHQISLRGNQVCRQTAGNPQTAKVQRMIANQRTFSGLSFGKR
ncbi:hypothetical protein D3C84_1156230 [compost metagenome]